MQNLNNLWFLYIIQSLKDNSLYTGITKGIKKRLEKHNNGKGSKYTRSRTPFVLVYSEEYSTKSEALKRELKIKSLSRKEKLEIIGKIGKHNGS